MLTVQVIGYTISFLTIPGLLLYAYCTGYRLYYIFSHYTWPAFVCLLYRLSAILFLFSLYLACFCMLTVQVIGYIISFPTIPGLLLYAYCTGYRLYYFFSHYTWPAFVCLLYRLSAILFLFPLYLACFCAYCTGYPLYFFFFHYTWPTFVCLLESLSAILFIFPLYLKIL